MAQMTASTITAQMYVAVSAAQDLRWQPLAHARRRCGKGEPSPGADVARGGPVSV